MLEGVPEGNGLWERESWTIPHTRERKTSRENGSHGEGEGQTLLEAKYTENPHVDGAQVRRKLPEHARRLKIFTSVSIWEPLPNLCHIKYI